VANNWAAAARGDEISRRLIMGMHPGYGLGYCARPVPRRKGGLSIGILKVSFMMRRLWI
jgi:hypothetical protein